MPRFGRHLAETGGNATKALAFYGRNARVSAAFLHPLHIFEVILHNDVAAAIEAEHGPDWHIAPWFPGLAACTRPRQGARRQGGSGDEVLFLSGLLTARHDTAVWNRHFVVGFPGAPVTSPGNVPRWRRLHEEAEAVREFRNRVAHHKPVLMRNLRSEYARILQVVRWHDRATAAWLHKAQSVLALVGQKH